MITRTKTVGEWVTVKPLAEIVATLDVNGCVDGLPFMPEMIQFCGRTFQVQKSAHKTCDPTGASDLRRMTDTVHLATRCDGNGHDGCQARCLIYWKSKWLSPAHGPSDGAEPPQAVPTALADTTRYTTADGIRYKCQATQIVAASTPIPKLAMKHYLEDVQTGNITAGVAARNIAIAAGQTFASKIFRMAGIKKKSRKSTVKHHASAPLDLRPGELVEVRSLEEILPTLKNGKNRGLSFENEMSQYCGQVFRVLGRVARLIDERTGRMINLKNDCIILQGIVCKGLENRFRLFCPRSPYLYWRELWLKRV